tara:strand:+ start:532 stop:954 length:423 start_codon:yes stop_codon:yes gene_type:complete
MEEFLNSNLNKLNKNYREYLYSNDNKSINSYKGHNPICFTNSNSCSIEKAHTTNDLCFWHEQKIGKLVKVSCDCSDHYLITDDDNNLLKDYLKDKDIFTTTACKDFTTLYCCGIASNIETNFKCGIMKVCDYCKYKHKKI